MNVPVSTFDTALTLILIFLFFAEITWIVGIWGIFRKFGVKGWWALIPGGRKYWLGRCAGDINSGRVLCIIDFLLLFCHSYLLFGDENSTPYQGVEILTMLLAIGYFIYSWRLYSRLCVAFGKRRWQVVLWICFPSIMALIWGWSDKYQPVQKVNIYSNSDPVLSVQTKKALAESVEDQKTGLVVRLKYRAVRDFLTRRYLLRDIYLSIDPGRMVLLLGGSGAGKTTLVNAIIGYEKANAKILLNDKDVYSDYELMKYDIGFVPQLDLIRGNDTVMQTLIDAALLRLPTTVPTKKIDESVKETLEKFGLYSLRYNLVEKLSGGQRKRLSIAMEYISDPFLFVLDEPDSGLDGVVSRDLFKRLRAIADSGKIVLVISHTPDRAIDLFDDVIVLAKDSRRTGRLAFYGSVNDAREFFERPTMEQILQCVNQKDEGGEGRAEEFIAKYAERQVAK